MTLRYALFASFGSRSFFGTRLAFFAALGAIYGFGRSRAWRAPERQRRVTVGLRRRTLLVMGATSVCWSSVFVGLYQYGAVTTRTADGGVQVRRSTSAYRRTAPQSHDLIAGGAAAQRA